MAFPQVGLQVILDIKQFQAQQTKLEKMLGDLSKTFPQVGAAMQRAFVSPATQQALTTAADKIKYWADIASYARNQFNQLAADTKTSATMLASASDKAAMAETMRGNAVKQMAGIQKQASTEMVQGMAGIAATAAIATAAIGILIKVVDDCTKAFMAQENELRMLQAVMGTTNLETAAFLELTEDLGLGVAGLEKAFAAFSRQFESLSLAEEEGIIVTNNFSRAMDRIFAGEDWKDIAPTEAFLRLSEQLAKIPSQAERSALALMLTGRQNKEALILITEMSNELQAAAEDALKYGNVQSKTSEQVAKDWRKANAQLISATSGLKAMWGELFTALKVAVVPALAEAVNWLRKASAATVSAASAAITFISVWKNPGDITTAWKAAGEVFTRVQDELLKKTAEAEDAQEQLAKKEGEAASAAEHAARIRENAMKKEAEALKELQEARDEAFESYQRGLADLARSEQRAAIERNLRAGWEVEDTLRKRLEREQDLERDYNRRLEDIRLEQGRKQQDDTKQRQRKLEDLERAHQLRLIQIQLDYQDAVEEALRSNDAVAILAAMRTRKRAIRDEELKQKEQRDTIRIEGERTREDQLKDLEQRRQDALRDYQNRLADMQLAIQREDEEKVRQNDRDKILRALQHKWALEDLKRQYQEELAEAEKAYLKQREEYAQFLTDMGNQSASGVIAISNQIANAINTGSRTVLLAEEQWLKRHFYLLSEAVHSSIGLSAEEQWRQRHSYLRAEGGVDVVNRPTNFVAGEAGPEIAAFIPLRHTMSINHSFGNLGVSMNGQSMNMNQGQMENVFWALMMQLPDLLSGRR